MGIIPSAALGLSGVSIGPDGKAVVDLVSSGMVARPNDDVVVDLVSSGLPRWLCENRFLDEVNCLPNAVFEILDWSLFDAIVEEIRNCIF
jgi:hypothetical protein